MPATNLNLYSGGLKTWGCRSLNEAVLQLENVGLCRRDGRGPHLHPAESSGRMNCRAAAGGPKRVQSLAMAALKPDKEIGRSISPPVAAVTRTSKVEPRFIVASIAASSFTVA